MAAENNRPRVGSLRSAEAGLHLHRRAEALRTAGGSGRDSGSAARCHVELNLAESAFAAWWRTTIGPALWWRIARRFTLRSAATPLALAATEGRGREILGPAWARR